MNMKLVTLGLAALTIVLFFDSDQLSWTVAKASGFVATLLLVGSMCVGIISSTKMAKSKFHAGDMFEVHRISGYLMLLAIAVHTIGLLADDYIGFSLSSVLIPGVSHYRPVAVGAGIIAAYLSLVVAFSFDLKQWLGPKFWRVTHMLSYPLLALALVHGVLAGTDTGSLGTQVFYYGCGFLVTTLTIFRILTPRPGPARRSKNPA
jgi:methionine sulfoxide reductase heme-binding subunit